MQYRSLGASGLKVSAVALGCMSFGRWVDPSVSARILDAALDAGINLIDTANVYGPNQDSGDFSQAGASERILGEILGERRSRIVLATKVNGAMGPGPNERGLSRGHIMAACEASLKRLRTDHIDLYQVHRWDPDTPLEETLGALTDLVRQGKVRYLGCSNFAAWQLVRALGISALRRFERFVSIQPQYSLIVRDAERELFPTCLSEGVGAIVYSPLARGLLSGKYRPGEAPPPGSRGASEPRMQSLMKEGNLKKVQALAPLAREAGLTLPQFAVAWTLMYPAVTAAILGATRPEQVTESAAGAAASLPRELMDAVDKL